VIILPKYNFRLKKKNVKSGILRHPYIWLCDVGLVETVKQNFDGKITLASRDVFIGNVFKFWFIYFINKSGTNSFYFGSPEPIVGN
jgi:hypothetical protein